jgi:replicative DNA helicase
MIEKLIFSNLVNNEEYGRKVIPFLKEEYFTNYSDKIIFNLIWDYMKEYNTFPSKEALGIDLSNKEGINQQTFTDCKETIGSIEFDPSTKLDWLLDKTEQFCQEKAVYNAIMKSIEIIDNKNNQTSKGAIPQILTDALGVSFDSHIGHDFLDDAESRYEFYHTREVRIPFDLHYMNAITQGGIPRKTLNVILAGTGVGKSLAMCHMAAANMAAGFNVLYITLEMAEERIAERIDANLLDVTIDDLKLLPRDSYNKKIEKLRNKVKGKLKIKEYPTATAGSANFRHLLNELKIKKNFIPDIIYIDYLNICISSRIKNGANVNSYTIVKAIAEELRGLAVENNVPIVTATQTTRGGYCVALDTLVFANNQKKKIVDVNIGDDIDSYNGKNKVLSKFPVVKKKGYKITLKSGKEIICSKDHLFPTKEGERSIKTGLIVGELLQVKSG